MQERRPDRYDQWGIEYHRTRSEDYLNAAVRVGMSCFQRLEPAELERGLKQLAADLQSGVWDARHGHLRHTDELDCGHRLIVADASY
jgi:hypothetical protein